MPTVSSCNFLEVVEEALGLRVAVGTVDGPSCCGSFFQPMGALKRHTKNSFDPESVGVQCTVNQVKNPTAIIVGLTN